MVCPWGNVLAPHEQRSAARHAASAAVGFGGVLDGQPNFLAKRHLQGMAVWIVDEGLSLSRLNHWLPRMQAHPEIVQGTAELHHESADALLPQADPVFHHVTTLDAA